MYMHKSAVNTSVQFGNTCSEKKWIKRTYAQFSKLDPFVNDGFLIKHLMIIRKNFILFRVIAGEAQSS